MFTAPATGGVTSPLLDFALNPLIQLKNWIEKKLHDLNKILPTWFFFINIVFHLTFTFCTLPKTVVSMYSNVIITLITNIFILHYLKPSLVIVNTGTWQCTSYSKTTSTYFFRFYYLIIIGFELIIWKDRLDSLQVAVPGQLYCYFQSNLVHNVFSVKISSLKPRAVFPSHQ